MTEDTYKKTLKVLEILSGIWTIIEFIYRFSTSGAIAFLNLGFIIFSMTVTCHALYNFNIKYKDTVKLHLEDKASIQKLIFVSVALIVLTIVYFAGYFNTEFMSGGFEYILKFQILPCFYMSFSFLLPIAIPQYSKIIANIQCFFALIPIVVMAIGTIYIAVDQYGWFLGLILGIPFSGLIGLLVGFIPYYVCLGILSIVESKK